MDAYLEEVTLSDIEKYCDIQSIDEWNSAFVKTDEDDRLVNIVDSPMGSPVSGPPSPSLPKSEVQSSMSSPGSPFSDFDQFNFNTSETLYATMNILPEDDKKVQTNIFSNCSTTTDSLDTWLSNTVNSNAEIVNFSPEDAAALLAGVSPETKQETISELSNEMHEQESVIGLNDISSAMFDYNCELLTEDELLNLSVKALNRRLANYPKDVQRQLKQKRRTLKNRGYAQNCRTKRMKTQQELEQDNDKLINQLASLKKQIGSFRSVCLENETMKAELHLLRSEVTSLRQENQLLKITRNS